MRILLVTRFERRCFAYGNASIGQSTDVVFEVDRETWDRRHDDDSGICDAAWEALSRQAPDFLKTSNDEPGMLAWSSVFEGATVPLDEAVGEWWKPDRERQKAERSSREEIERAIAEVRSAVSRLEKAANPR